MYELQLKQHLDGNTKHCFSYQYLYNKGRSQINNLSLYLEKLKNKLYPKQGEILKSRVEINKVENRK